MILDVDETLGMFFFSNLFSPHPCGTTLEVQAEEVNAELDLILHLQFNVVLPGLSV